ncbi:methyl-accepting chemotaxis protein [bacterium]|nr:methyl-accepting chemotaxis protein [bacterium]
MNKRKKINLSIKKGMQLRLIFRIFTIILLAVILSGMIFLLGSHRKVESTYRQFHVQLKNFREMILPLAIAGFIAGLMGALILSFFFPLRLAGPIYRIEKSIQKAATGDLTDLKLNIRSRDEFHELASHVNSMMQKINGCIMSVKDENKKMNDVYKRMYDALINQDMDEARKALFDMGNNINNINGVIDEFKV